MNKTAVARKRLREKLAALKPWQQQPFNWYDGLTYQSCRFCKRGFGDVPALWQYSLRAYICDDCKRTKEAEGGPQ